MTKIMFDVNRSLAECPPEIYYSQLGTDGKPLFPGIHYKKRVVLNRNRETGVVTFRLEDQIREEDAGEDRVAVVEGSYSNLGFLYNKIPQAVIVDPNNPKRFLGVVGFGRDEAQENLGWESAIYDVIEYDKPIDLESFKVNSNDDEDHVPAFPNTKTTIIKSVVSAIDKKVITDDDEAILAYLKRIARSKPKWHEPILTTIRKEHISRWPTMKALSTARAKKEAIRLNLPFEGNKNKKNSSLGYARKFTSLKNFFWDGLTMSVNYGWQKVYLSTWVDEPNPQSLPTDRKKIKEEFDKMEGMFDIWVSHYLDMPIEEVRKKSEGRFPLIFNGFFAQDEEKQTDEGGVSKEVDLVGDDGKPWKRLDV
jgi:hypothetical protein